MRREYKLIVAYYLKRIGIYSLFRWIYMFLSFFLCKPMTFRKGQAWNIKYEIHEKGFHIWSGYYDINPLNRNNALIAYMKVPIKGGRKNDACIEIMDVVHKEIVYKDYTKAWNWQQGCMLQWLNDRYSDIIYNIYDSQEGVYKAKRVNILNGETFYYIQPIYAKHPVEEKFLSLNFSRLNLYAYDYGYQALNIENLDDDLDGVCEVDMKLNLTRLLFSISDVVHFEPKSEFDAVKHYVNHLAYSLDGNSVLFIHRWSFYSQYNSRLLMYDIQNETFKLLLDCKFVSHFCWKDKFTLLIYARNNKQQMGYFEIDIRNGFCSEIYKNMPLVDGHPSFSVNGKIATDTYPDKKRIQYLISGTLEEPKVIYSFYSPFKYYDGNRCDLHPKWSYDGLYICVDTTYRGCRSLCVLSK